VTPVRVAIAGAGGRMGRALLEAATSTPGVVLASALEAAGSPFAGRDAGELPCSNRTRSVGTTTPSALAMKSGPQLALLLCTSTHVSLSVATW